MSGAEPGCIAYKRRTACAHDAAEQIPITTAVRVIQRSLQDYEDRINAAIASGRSFYVNNKTHSADCPSLQRILRPTESWYWVTESDNPEVIKERYTETVDGTGGGGFYITGRLCTREEAAKSTAKRCQICAPDVIPRIATKRPKKVAGLGAGDLGRLLDGQPIESITYEPGVVIVRTSDQVHLFDPAASVVLDVVAGSPQEAAEPPQH